VVAFERLGIDLPATPIERVVEPRLDRHDVHLHARREEEIRAGAATGA
jgi:hypothetical protein